MTLGTQTGPGLRVTYHGVSYHADTVAGGAAYELFSDVGEDGFTRNPQVGALMPYRRFVHATDVFGALPQTPLQVPLSRTFGWEQVQRLSQLRPRPEHADLITSIRGTATVRRGTRMVKVVSLGEAAGYLRGGCPGGSACGSTTSRTCGRRPSSPSSAQRVRAE